MSKIIIFILLGSTAFSLVSCSRESVGEYTKKNHSMSDNKEQSK